MVAIVGYFSLCVGLAMVGRMGTVGQILQRAREGARLSQAQLAERAGVSVHVIRKLEQGQVDEPTWRNIVSLAQALGVSLDLFTGGPPPAVPTKAEPKRGPGRPRKGTKG